MTPTRLEDLPAELFFCIFDYFWAHELFFSFFNLNRRLNELILDSQLHISSEHQDVLYKPDHVRSLTLTTAPVSLDDYVNLRSLTLIKCNLQHFPLLPQSLLRLSLEHIDLPLEQIEFIFHHPTFIHLHLNLHHQFIFPSSILTRIQPSSHLQYLTINYIILNDLIHLLAFVPCLKYLRVSLFGMNARRIPNISPLMSVKRIICLPLNVPFDVLASQFLSIYFPNVENLSIFTSYVDHNVLINSLEEMLIHHLHRVKKLNVSAQFLLHRSHDDNAPNLEMIARRFRTAFWLKRNSRTLFKCCQNDTHDIRLYLQTNSKTRPRPSRFQD